MDKKGGGGYLAVILEGADDVETTACDGEHPEHDAEGQDCLKREILVFGLSKGMDWRVPPMELACCKGWVGNNGRGSGSCVLG